MSARILGVSSRHLWQTFVNGGQKLFSPKVLLYTNIGISTGLSAFGDISQQFYQAHVGKNNRGWDKRRTQYVAATGFAIAPFVHYWYIFLDRWLPGHGMKVLCKKVLLDQVFCSPVYIGIFLLGMSLMEGRTLQNVTDDFKHKGSVLYVAEWCVWPPAQFINFCFLPTKYRVLYDNTISLAFDVFWSYVWFEMDDEDADKRQKQCSDSLLYDLDKLPCDKEKLRCDDDMLQCENEAL